MSKYECQAGHTNHETKWVWTAQGKFLIYDWRQYQDFDGYCPGQDDVSMTLDLYGHWEAPDWDRARALNLQDGVVLDFGAHIGWYAITFAEMGHHVVCVEANSANIELLNINLRERNLEAQVIHSTVEAIDTLTVPDVRFIKSDVEGAELAVFLLCRDIIKRDHPMLLLECSPEFDTYYPEMLQTLIHMGYRSSLLPHELKTQANVWLT